MRSLLLRSLAGLMAAATLILSCAVPSDRRAVAPTEPSLSQSSANSVYIVVLEPSAGDPKGFAQAQGITPRFAYSHVLRGFSASLSPQAADALEKNPNVSYVEQVGIASINDVQAPTPSWGLDRIDQRGSSLYGDFSYTYTATGQGAEVYVIDTGIMPLSDYASRLTIGPDFSGDPVCCHWHASHVAGTAAGTVFGVAKGAHLTSVRVLGQSGSAPWDYVVAGIDWVAGNHAPRSVVNMSIGGEYNQAVNDAVDALVASGVTVAVAAGNAFDNACFYSPAGAPSAIAVAAIGNFDEQTDFSNWGPCVALYAPGQNIRSDYPYDAFGQLCDTCSRLAAGTSMASPHVAGIAALYLETHPTATPTQVRAAILANATQGAVQNYYPDRIGTPNLLAYSLLTVEPTPTPTPPPPSPGPVVAFSVSCKGQRSVCTMNAGSSTGVAPLSFTWVFGDGQSATTSDVKTTHTYAAIGTYQVTLTVKDGQGLTSSLTKSVTVRKL